MAEVRVRARARAMVVKRVVKVVASSGKHLDLTSHDLVLLR
jgi:hypothetical protein